jgi:hypothetical protein
MNISLSGTMQEEESGESLEVPGAFAISRINDSDRMTDTTPEWDPTERVTDNIQQDNRPQSPNASWGRRSSLEAEVVVADADKEMPRAKWPLYVFFTILVAFIIIGVVVMGLILPSSQKASPIPIGSPDEEKEVPSLSSDKCYFSNAEDVPLDPFIQCSCFGVVVRRTDEVEQIYHALKEAQELPIFIDENTAIDSCSPENMAALWVAAQLAITNITLPFEIIEARLLLAYLYKIWNGDDWVHSDQWLTETSHCEWFGLSCDEWGRVSSIILPRNNVTGPLPPKLGLFWGLKSLDLTDNHIAGSIPSDLWNIPNLGKSITFSSFPK